MLPITKHYRLLCRLNGAGIFHLIQNWHSWHTVICYSPCLLMDSRAHNPLSIALSGDDGVVVQHQLGTQSWEWLKRIDIHHLLPVKDFTNKYLFTSHLTEIIMFLFMQFPTPWKEDIFKPVSVTQEASFAQSNWCRRWSCHILWLADIKIGNLRYLPIWDINYWVYNWFKKV